MATLDQLAPRQRAILELVLQRGQSYEELSGMLSLPVPRVRELAREALVELAPASARNVDPQWRGQLADYLLGQQSGPESRATEGHLEASEEARMWSSSLLDSLDTLYEEAERPVIPAGAPPGRGRRRRSRAIEANGEAITANGEPPALATPATRTEDGAEGFRSPEESSDLSGGTSAAPYRRRTDPSVARRGVTAVRQRGIAIVAGVVIVALLVAGILYAFATGDEAPQTAAPPPGTPAPGGPPGGGQAPPGQPQVLGQIPLRASPGEEGRGRALIAQQGSERALVVQASRIEGVGRDELLEVWFFNSRQDARSIGAQRVRGGAFQGLGSLPGDWQRYRYVDISRESADGNAAHSGDSVLRGETAAGRPAAR